MSTDNYTRYVARTEAWGRDITEREDIVGTNGKVTAFPGDVHVVQNLRGETFSYVMTRDDFDQDWRAPDDVDTKPATSEHADPGELSGAVVPVSTDEENPVETPVQEPVFSTATAAPTGAAPQDGDVQGTATPPPVTETEPAPPAPPGSAASEVTQADVWEPTEEPAQPDTTTPTQTVAPSQDPGGAGTSAPEPVGDAVTATPDKGGDDGATPTPSPALPGESGGVADTAPADNPSPAPPDEPTPDVTPPPVKTLPGKANGTT